MSTLGFLDYKQWKGCLVYLSKNIFISWNLLDILLDGNQGRNKGSIRYPRFQKLSKFGPSYRCRNEWVNQFFPFLAIMLEIHISGKESPPNLAWVLYLLLGWGGRAPDWLSHQYHPQWGKIILPPPPSPKQGVNGKLGWILDEPLTLNRHLV